MYEKRECSEAVEVLYHYLDGQLTEERRVLIRHHLDDCPPCLDAFDFEAELRMVIAHKCRERVPESLRLRVAQAIRGALQESDGEAGRPLNSAWSESFGPFSQHPPQAE